jgi:predicted Zn-dependent protease
MSHELGHAFGLDHCTVTSVMNQSRDRDTIYLTQDDDIDGLIDSWD